MVELIYVERVGICPGLGARSRVLQKDQLVWAEFRIEAVVGYGSGRGVIEARKG